MEDDDYDDDFDDFEEDDSSPPGPAPKPVAKNIITKKEERKEKDIANSSASNTVTLNDRSRRSGGFDENKEKEESTSQINNHSAPYTKSGSDVNLKDLKVNDGRNEGFQTSKSGLKKNDYEEKDAFEGNSLRNNSGAERIGKLIKKNIKKISSQSKHFNPEVGIQTEFIDTKDQSHQVTCLGDDTQFVNSISRIEKNSLLKKEDPDFRRKHEDGFRKKMQEAQKQEEINTQYLVSFLKRFSPVCETLLDENIAYSEYEKSLNIQQQQQKQQQQFGRGITINDNGQNIGRNLQHEEIKNENIPSLQRNDWNISRSFDKKKIWHHLIQHSTCGGWNQGRYISDIIFNPYNPHYLISIHTPIDPQNLKMSTVKDNYYTNNINQQQASDKHRSKNRRSSSNSSNDNQEEKNSLDEQKEGNNYKSNGNKNISYFPEKDIIAIWDVGNFSKFQDSSQTSSSYHPKLKKLLFGDGRITAVSFGPGFQTQIIIAGTEDGTLLMFDLWNRRTLNGSNTKGNTTLQTITGSAIDIEYSDHLEQTFFGCKISNKSKFEILFPSYTTTSNLDSIGHYSSIVSVIPLISAGIDPTLSKASEFSFLSMDDRGIISFWKISSINVLDDEPNLLADTATTTSPNSSKHYIKGKENSKAIGLEPQKSNNSSLAQDEGGDYIGISPCSRIKLQLTRSIDLTHSYSPDNLTRSNQPKEKDFFDRNHLLRQSKERQYQKYKKKLRESISNPNSNHNNNKFSHIGFTGGRKVLSDIHFHDMDEVRWDIPINDLNHIDAIGPLTTTILPFPHDPSRLLIGLCDGSILHRSRFGERIFPTVYNKCDFYTELDFQIEDSSLKAAAAVIEIVPNLQIQHLFLVGYMNGIVALFSEKFATPLKTWSYTDFDSSNSIRKHSQKRTTKNEISTLDYRNIAVKQIMWSPHRPGVFYVLFSNSAIIYVMDLLCNIYESVASITIQEEMSLTNPEIITSFTLSNPSPAHQSTGQTPFVAISTTTTLKYYSLEKIFFHSFENERRRLETLIDNSSSFHLKTPESVAMYE